MPDVTFFFIDDEYYSDRDWMGGWRWRELSNFYGPLLKIIQIFPTSIELLFDFHNAPALKQTPI